MKRPIDTILFDFDYTLADSSSGIGKCINLALEALDFPAVDSSTACNTIGLSLKDTFMSLVGTHHHAYADAFVRLFVSYADMIMVEHTVLLPFVSQMVRRLHKDAYQMGIVSNNRRYRIEAVLQNERISSQFQVIVGEEDVSQHKPEPEGLLAAMERLNCTPARTIYVGDSTVDAETARRANVPFVAVLSGITTREAFDRYDSYAVVDNLCELPHVLLSHHMALARASQQIANVTIPNTLNSDITKVGDKFGGFGKFLFQRLSKNKRVPAHRFIGDTAAGTKRGNRNP